MFKSIRQGSAYTILVAVVTIAVLIMSIYAVSQIQQRQEQDQSQALQDVITKTAIQCYALEGSYPPNLDYLTEHYGLILNESRYFYFYDAQGANMLPKIVVIKR